MNVTPPPPSQNSHAVGWHCTAGSKGRVTEIKGWFPSSPDWSASLRPSLERKTRPDALIGPNDSTATGWNYYHLTLWRVQWQWLPAGDEKVEKVAERRRRRWWSRTSDVVERGRDGAPAASVPGSTHRRGDGATEGDPRPPGGRQEAATRSASEAPVHALSPPPARPPDRQRRPARVHFRFAVQFALGNESVPIGLQYIGWQWRDFVPYLCQPVVAAIL